MDKLNPPWPLPPAVSGQRPVSRVPAAAAGAEWAGPQEGGPRRMEVGRGKRMVAFLSRTVPSSCYPAPSLEPIFGQYLGSGGSTDDQMMCVNEGRCPTFE